MQKIREAATSFLSHKRIAVTGVSRNPGPHGSNAVYRRLREKGYEVFAVNPNAAQVEGDPAYPNLASIPGGVDAVVIGTRPDHAEATVRECDELGVKDVWMHRSFGGGSVSDAATQYGRDHGITVIDGGCPLMFEPCSDSVHKAFRSPRRCDVMASQIASRISAGVPRMRTKGKEVKPMEVIAFAAVIVLWVGFAALLFFSQSSFDDAWTWFRDQSLVVQVPLAFLFLPWVVGAWIWESSWPIAARGFLVAAVAWVNVYTFSPWKPVS